MQRFFASIRQILRQLHIAHSYHEKNERLFACKCAIEAKTGGNPTNFIAHIACNRVQFCTLGDEMNEVLSPPVWPEYKVPLDPFFAWTPINRDAPIAYVSLKRLKVHKSFVNQWEVVRCPYCRSKHTHGAGESGDDPRAFLGGRVAHCDASNECDEYRLVEWEGQELPTAPRSIRVFERIPLSREVRAEVWAKTNGRCWYCGDETNPFGDFRVDHVHPVAAGGSDDLTNLVPSCHSCNAKKHALPMQVFRDRCVFAQFNGGKFWFEVEGIE